MIDTHAHIQDERYENLDEVIMGAKALGVNKIVCASSDIQTSKKAINIAEKFENVYATVGVHPEEANKFNENTINELRKMAEHKKVVAIGEIGLDYYHIFASKELQQEIFVKQIDLANELKMPVVVHSRDAVEDTINILKQNKEKLKYGVCIHCFNMSLEILKLITSWGFYISIGGIVTFKNANNILKIAEACPIDKLLLETDSPYLTPVPYRSKMNEPKYVVITAQKIAEIKGLTLKELDDITTQNAIKFFNLK